PAFEAVEISDLSLNDNPTRAIRTLHRSDPRRPGVLLRRYDTTHLEWWHGKNIFQDFLFVSSGHLGASGVFGKKAEE
ncbi:hypothetical protein, partial [Propionibacterium freudenreichii]|uniref:hypothetical protein n=1 Tax=Propionibacterium freudenreichii TaxID=1744 RepID=UPI00254AB6E5